MAKARLSMESRFWNFVEPMMDDRGCWEWSGSLTPGKWRYAKLGNHGKTGGWIKASRFSWELHYGQIPDGLFVCHKCDNPACVNPSHLFIGTARQNTRDMMAKGRAKFSDMVKPSRARTEKASKREVCGNGHPRLLFAYRNKYQVICRECHRLYARAQRAKKNE